MHSNEHELLPYGVEVQQTLVDRAEIDKQLKHANEQLALSNIYPGRRGDTRSTLIAANAPARLGSAAR